MRDIAGEARVLPDDPVVDQERAPAPDVSGSGGHGDGCWPALSAQQDRQCDEQMQYVREVTPKIIDGVLTRLFEVQTRPRDEIIRLQTDDLAGIRYRKETGDIELEGMKILTDRESQAQLTGVYQSLASGLINANRLESAGWLDDGDKGADRAGSHSRCRVFCRRKSGIGTDSAF